MWLEKKLNILALKIKNMDTSANTELSGSMSGLSSTSSESTQLCTVFFWFILRKDEN